VEEGSEQGIAVIDTATWTRRLYPVTGGAAFPTFSPDGAHVVFETGGAGGAGVDIAVLSLPSGAVKKIVEGKSEKRLPLFSADGKRVVFEVRYHDPVFPRARAVSRIASVAFEP
jgi:Tol biopolymer transport system component